MAAALHNGADEERLSQKFLMRAKAEGRDVAPFFDFGA